MIVKRRTFEALKHPPGSTERAELNLDSLTSEYYPSHRYCLRQGDGSKTAFTYPTKHAAEWNCERYTLQQIAPRTR